MLGATLVDLWRDKYDIYATGNSDFYDNPAKNYKAFNFLTDDVATLIEWADPQIIVHCAAVTNMDYCEKHPDEAYELNGHSIQKLLSHAPNARLVYISTDAVFKKDVRMADEKTKASPDTVYGGSKKLGEDYILASNDTHLIVRTTLVGKNINPNKESFTDWIIKSLRKGSYVNLFDDVIFSPLTTWHISDEIEWMMHHSVPKIIHLNSTDSISKYDFGLLLCEYLGLNCNLIRPQSLKNISFLAPRSDNQTLDIKLYQSVSNRSLPSIKNIILTLASRYK